MQVQEIRKRFIQFFQSKGHQYLPSSSLVPTNDPSLLFTNAGMNQFKDYFTGKVQSPYKRAVTIQKCVRAGGKHNDLENVGFTARHHTFFEMLGNFSFGDYFKHEAIAYAWEFLTKELKIPATKLYVTVHYTDDEAKKIWHEEIGIPLDKIFTRDKDNFWEMGEFGPCGPCSEIFYDHGPENASPGPKNDLLDDETRYVEIWNLVFMQYEKSPSGTTPLPKPCIDTGAGLERLAAVMQSCYWNYDTDCFTPIIKKLEHFTGKNLSDIKYTSNLRVISDHIRSSTMLITDGVIPSNEGRGYVLRRIIRRAIRHLKELGAIETSFYKLVPTVFEILGDIYPENRANAETATKYLQLEEDKFRETLDLGLKFLEESLKDFKGTTLPGEVAFKLFDTYGLPLDLTELILRERSLQVDHAGFEEAMNKQKELSKKSWKGMGSADDKSLFNQLLAKLGTTTFVGYESIEAKGKLLHSEQLPSSHLWLLVFDKTSFYGESGGQLGDSGKIYLSENKESKENKENFISVVDTGKPLTDFIVHYAEHGDQLKIGESYRLVVDQQKRNLTARNHTATHLLQQALIDVLGKHIKQAGSSVSSDRLRFDFTHPIAVKKEELERIEKIVNNQIAKNLPVTPIEMDKDEAVKRGATALFGEKYGDRVRVVQIEQYSQELCGGTHVHSTGEIASFSVLSESSLSSGIRRIEAVSSDGAVERLIERSLMLEKIEKLLKLPFDQLTGRIEQMLEKIKHGEDEKSELLQRIDRFQSEQLFNNPEEIAPGFLYKVVEVQEGTDLRRFSDYFIDRYPQGVVLLHMNSKGKRSLLLRTHKDNHFLDCSTIFGKTLPLLQGKGGGRKDMSQGSGDAQCSLEHFLRETREILIHSLKNR